MPRRGQRFLRQQQLSLATTLPRVSADPVGGRGWGRAGRAATAACQYSGRHQRRVPRRKPSVMFAPTSSEPLLRKRQGCKHPGQGAHPSMQEGEARSHLAADRCHLLRQGFGAGGKARLGRGVHGTMHHATAHAAQPLRVPGRRPWAGSNEAAHPGATSKGCLAPQMPQCHGPNFQCMQLLPCSAANSAQGQARAGSVVDAAARQREVDGVQPRPAVRGPAESGSWNKKLLLRWPWSPRVSCRATREAEKAKDSEGVPRNGRAEWRRGSELGRGRGSRRGSGRGRRRGRGREKHIFLYS